MRFIKIILSLLLFCSIVLISGAAPASADSLQQESSLNPNISLTATAGFDGLRKGFGWLPIQVTAANSGPAVEGELQVTTGSDRPIFSTPITLPNQSNKRVSFPVYLPINSTQLTVELVDETGTLIQLAATNNIKTLDENSMLYGAITPDPDALDQIDSATAGRGEGAVAFLTIEDLPTSTLSLSMLDVIILNNVDSSQFSASQLSALDSWLQFGGQLVITGGANWQQTTAALGDWLPVTPTDTISVDDLPTLAETFREAFRDPGPYVITTSSLKVGELLLHENNIPLLARRPFGRGSVFFLALDPQFAPLDDWDGSGRLWNEIARYAPQTPVWGRDFRNEDRAGNAVESLPTLSLPSPALFFLFIGAYIIIIGPVNYMVLNRMNKREWAWRTIPLTILIFSVFAFVAGVQFKGNRVIINQMSVVYGPIGADEARVHSAVGLYSPRRGEYNITFNDAPWVRPMNSFGVTRRDINITSGTTTNISNFLVDVSDVSSFSTVGQRPMPNITAQAILTQEEDSVILDITVTNNTGQALEHATLLIANDNIALGTLESGETRNVSKIYRLPQRMRAITNAAAGRQSFTSASTASATSPLETHYPALLGTSSYYYSDNPIVNGRYQLLESFGEPYGTPSQGWVPEGVVTLVGWSDVPQLDIELTRTRYDVSASTVYFLEIPYQQ